MEEVNIWMNKDDFEKDSFQILESDAQPRQTESTNWHGPFENFKEVKTFGLNYFITDKDIAQQNINDLRYMSQKMLIRREV